MDCNIVRIYRNGRVYDISLVSRMAAIEAMDLMGIEINEENRFILETALIAAQIAEEGIRSNAYEFPRQYPHWLAKLAAPD